MPRSKRGNLKRKAGAVRTNLDRALTHVLELKVEYTVDHPDYAETLETIGKAIVMVDNLVGQFADSI